MAAAGQTGRLIAALPGARQLAERPATVTASAALLAAAVELGHERSRGGAGAMRSEKTGGLLETFLIELCSAAMRAAPADASGRCDHPRTRRAPRSEP
jgi:hypothetical protein